LPFLPNFYMHSSSPHPCYIPCPCHPPWHDNFNYTWRTVQVMKLPIMQFSPTYHFIPLRSKFFLSALFSNNLILSFYVSHPYRTTGKIIGSLWLPFLIFLMLGRQ
jgi:hypothetical protein